MDIIIKLILYDSKTIIFFKLANFMFKLAPKQFIHFSISIRMLSIGTQLNLDYFCHQEIQNRSILRILSLPQFHHFNS